MNQKLHIPITNQDEVKSSSTGSGMVTAVSWKPDVGSQQAEDIACAKQRAFDEMMEAERKANDPNEQRFCLLENRLQIIENKMDELLELYGQK